MESNVINILNNIGIIYKRKELLEKIVKMIKYRLTPSLLIVPEYKFDKKKFDDIINYIFLNLDGLDKKITLYVNIDNKLYTYEYDGILESPDLDNFNELMKLYYIVVNNILIFFNNNYYDNIIKNQLKLFKQTYYINYNLVYHPHYFDEKKICFIKYKEALIVDDNINNIYEGFVWIIKNIALDIILKIDNTFIKNNINNAEYENFIKFLGLYLTKHDELNENYIKSYFNLFDKNYEYLDKDYDDIIKIDNDFINNLLDIYFNMMIEQLNEYIFIIETGNDLFDNIIKKYLKNKKIDDNKFKNTTYDLKKSYYNNLQQTGGNYKYITLNLDKIFNVID